MDSFRNNGPGMGQGPSLRQPGGAMRSGHGESDLPSIELTSTSLVAAAEMERAATNATMPLPRSGIDKVQWLSWAGGVLLVALGFIAFTGPSEDPLENLFSFFDFGQSAPDENVGPAPARKQVRVPEVADEVDLSMQRPDFSLDMVSNPYWMLPNEPAPKPVAKKRVSAAEKETWQNGIAHEFPWQQYKIITRLRAARRLGAAPILYEALDLEKFWTRMEALIGLAELGYSMDLKLVEKGLGSARPSLIKNYFKRYLRHTSEGALYVLRFAIRVVDAKGRLMILRILSKKRDPINRIYMAAALYDPSPTIQLWLAEELEIRPVKGKTLSRYQTIVVDDYMTEMRAEQALEKDKNKEAVNQATYIDEVTDTEVVRRVEYFQDKADGAGADEGAEDEGDQQGDGPEEEALPEEDPDDGFAEMGGSMSGDEEEADTGDGDDGENDPDEAFN